VADAYGMSRHYMLKVTNELSHMGYIDAVRGRSGGVRLAKKPKDIRIGRLVRQTEPDPGVLDCIDRADVQCAILPACRLRKVFAEAQREFFNVLDRYTLADLIEDRQALAPLLGLGTS
jgi:Rrf2 family nitric oxide-sensitive transcriptional repressor